MVKKSRTCFRSKSEKTTPWVESRIGELSRRRRTSMFQRSGREFVRMAWRILLQLDAPDKITAPRERRERFASFASDRATSLVPVSGKNLAQKFQLWDYRMYESGSEA